jgi:hypothetical protein
MSIIPKEGTAKAFLNKVDAKAKSINKAVKAGNGEKEGYKDNYSPKIFETKNSFLETKLKRKTSKFSRFYFFILPLVNKGIKEIKIEVEKIGVDYVDPRLPRYVLGFIKDGENYFVRNPKLKELTKSDNSEGKTTGLIGVELIKK